MKNNLLLPLAFLLFAALPAQAQDLTPMAPVIKKKKYTKCVASKLYVRKGEKPGTEGFHTATWTFNAQGNVVTHERYNEKDTITVRSTHTYTPDGRILQTLEDNFHINEHEQIDYIYDQKNRLTSIEDRRDRKLIVTYKHYYGDDMLRDSTVWLDKNNMPELVEYYEYNGKGWLTGIKERTEQGRADGRTVLEYHDDGTLKDEILYDGFGNIFERMYYNEDGLLVKKEISYIDYQIEYTYNYNKKGLLESYTKSRSDQESYEVVLLKWSKK